MNNRATSQPRGFAIVVAIVLLGLTAVVMTIAFGLLRADVSRTGAEASQMQLDQLLLAGQDAAAAQLAQAGSVQRMALLLPASLDDSSLTVEPIQSGNAVDMIHVKVSAHLRALHAVQVLAYERHEHAWRLIDAERE